MAHPPDDLDRLAAALEAAQADVPPGGSRLEGWLRLVAERDASDLLLVAGGRVPAAELLIVGYGARQHVRRNALQHLHQEITITRRHGSFSLEECLVRLVKAGIVERGEAALRANHPEDFDHAMQA
jgi:Tfp pilus assembly pilus retraction ATPase PilT